MGRCALCRIRAIDQRSACSPRSIAGQSPIPSRMYRYGKLGLLYCKMANFANAGDTISFSLLDDAKRHMNDFFSVVCLRAFQFDRRSALKVEQADAAT